MKDNALCVYIYKTNQVYHQCNSVKTCSVRPEPVEACHELVEWGAEQAVKPLMVRQAHHERLNYTALGIS
ncbi:hypothetical protein B0F88_1129 [Methylobacter tundripaludum]|uniref:Uncharacterized protein n=1 Tax=Methylobacter tundripaludum TaxID=173365 RepID=A0A2S6GSF3_9GAMM|nr:hypothetical protein B0F88_1129 [Methylobacter tundripaludum]